MPNPDISRYGLIVVGDEILVGRRRDGHFEHFRELLRAHRAQLARFWLLPDDAATLTDHLRRSMEDALPVFVCGGIGATPDDVTRQCAAAASGRPLERHPGAVAILEQKFGSDAYPLRIRMAEFPAGSELIPNPYNGIAGFSVGAHYFLPGFPEMAWPMAEWVLAQRGERRSTASVDYALRVFDTPESSLIPLMEHFASRFPELKMFSLPGVGRGAGVELGFRGDGDRDAAVALLHRLLDERQMPFREADAGD